MTVQDMVRREAVFFDERCVAAIVGQPDDKALDILARRIADAEHDKQCGYGPPLDDINRIRRLWLDIYARHYGRAA